MNKKLASFALMGALTVSMFGISNSYAATEDDDLGALLEALSEMEEGETLDETELPSVNTDTGTNDEIFETTSMDDNMEEEMDLDSMMNEDSDLSEMDLTDTYSGEAEMDFEPEMEAENESDMSLDGVDFEPTNENTESEMDTDETGNLGQNDNNVTNGDKLTPTGLDDVLYFAILLSVIGGVFLYRRKKA